MSHGRDHGGPGARQSKWRRRQHMSQWATRYLSALALAVAAFATAAGAACPTGADMETTGVWIDFSDGSRVHYQRLGPEVVGEANYLPEDSESFFTKRVRGLWLAEDAPLIRDASNADQVITFDPSPGETEWPSMGPDMQWSGKVLTRDAGGVVVNSFLMSASVSGTDSVSISGCVFDADVIRIEEVFEDGGQAAEMRYLRDLGVAYVAATGPLGEEFELHAAPTWIGLKAPE